MSHVTHGVIQTIRHSLHVTNQKPSITSKIKVGYPFKHGFICELSLPRIAFQFDTNLKVCS
jgi:hypothetical protein